LNCSKSTISYHCSKLNIVKDRITINDDIVNQIVNLRKKKTSYENIRKITKVSLDKIKVICKVNGMVQLRSFGHLSDKEIKEIKKEYDKLKSIRQVTKKLGYSRETVRNYIVIENKKLTDDELKKNRSNSVIEWRKRKKEELVEYKGGKCNKCGYDKCLDALQFHHIDPKEKDFTISRKSYSIERLKKEVDKCILVCANCHLEIHYELKNINNAT
jgi:hypothetical protein